VVKHTYIEVKKTLGYLLHKFLFLLWGIRKANLWSR